MMIANLCLAALAPFSAPATQELASDRWTGWLYLDDGDVPFRLQLERDGDALRPIVDLPAAGQVGITLGSAAFQDGRLILAHPSVEDARIRIEAKIDGDEAHGPVDWFGTGGRVVLHACSVPLSFRDDEREYAGIYGAPGEVGVAVVERPWGELVWLDPSTGAERTLFRSPEGTFLVGPAMYVATPVERTVEFRFADDGSVRSVVETHEGRTRELPRREVRSEAVSVESGGATLHGTLLVPEGPPAPCAIIAGGSSWSSRASVESFALSLAAHGIATVAYDKRGYGDSSGDRTVPFATTAGDLQAFAHLARSREDIARVGYLAISRGGWYGALAAAGDEDCAFFTNVVGPAVSPIRQETDARMGQLRERGAAVEDLEAGRAYLDAQWRFARSSEGGDEYLEQRKRAVDAGWIDVLYGPESLESADWEWMRLNGDFDPREALGALGCPRVAIFGELDPSVATEVSAPLMRECWASRGGGEVVVLPGRDHGLRPAVRDARGLLRDRHASVGRDPELWRAIVRTIRSSD